ncbi:hypothetical protein EYV94_27185 [Puteibacter caeruleilacunae]|nr:hypothetical protein EYV94_27185 [Puteibacter caeruleilacunae]
MKIYNFNKNTLLCYNENHLGSSAPTKPYFFISKETGEITDYIDIEVKEVKPRRFVEQIDKNNSRGYSFRRNYPDNCKFGNYFILANRSMDTVYLLKQDKSLIPLFTQTPSVFSEHPTAAAVGMIINNRFLQVQVASYDYQKALKLLKKGEQWKAEYTDYTFDMTTGEFFKDPGEFSYSVREVDVPANKRVKLIQPYLILNSYKAGRIKDNKPLLELCPKLDIEDNPIIAIQTFR